MNNAEYSYYKAWQEIESEIGRLEALELQAQLDLEAERKRSWALAERLAGDRERCNIDVGLDNQGRHIWLRPENVRGYVEELRAKFEKKRGTGAAQEKEK